MTVMDHGMEVEEVPRSMPNTQPPPPPAGAQPVVSADGTVRRAQPAAKRPPIPRGTYAITGIGIGGTLLAVIGAAAGPIAVVATAAGIVFVPLAVWMRGKRKGKSGGQRRQRSQRTTRTTRTTSGGGSWVPGGGTSGGGHRGRGSSTSSGLASGAGRGQQAPSGARSAGLTGGSTSRGRSAGSAGAAGAPRGRGRAGASTGTAARGGSTGSPLASGRGRQAPAGARSTGLAGGPSSRGAARVRSAGSPGASHGRGRAAGGSTHGAARSGAAGRRLNGGGAAWSPTGRSPSTNHRAGAHGRGRGPGSWAASQWPGGTPSGHRPAGAWNPARHGRSWQRVAARVNGAGYRWGGAVGRGVRQQTPAAAWKAAWQQRGTHGYNPTTTGYLGRAVGGFAAALPAWLTRLVWNYSGQLGRSIRDTFRLPGLALKEREEAYAKEQAEQQAASQQQPAGQPKPAQQAAPNPAPTTPGQTPAPAGNPNPAGAPVGTNPGGTPVTRAYPAYNAAVDFFAAAAKWSPGPQSGAIWELEAALPLIRDSIHTIANGYAKTVANCELDLQGGLHPHMRGALTDVWNGLYAASQAAGNLPKAFSDAYADRIAARAVKGGQTTNV